jgi:hypothetical protein
VSRTGFGGPHVCGQATSVPIFVERSIGSIVINIPAEPRHPLGTLARAMERKSGDPDYERYQKTVRAVIAKRRRRIPWRALRSDVIRAEQWTAEELSVDRRFP